MGNGKLWGGVVILVFGLPFAGHLALNPPSPTAIVIGMAIAMILAFTFMLTSRHPVE